MLGGSLEKREHKLVIKWRFNFKWKISKLSLFVVFSCFSSVWLFATLWTVDHQAPLSLELSRWEYWSGMPCPSWGDGPNLSTESVSPVSPALQADSLPTETLGRLLVCKEDIYIYIYLYLYLHMGFLFGTNDDKLTCQCRRPKRCRLDLWVAKILWRRKWQPTPVFA